MQTTLYTIGHSSHPIAHFLSLLAQNHITLLADVRAIPASRRHPQYNRDPLCRALQACGIDYRFMGKQLGAKTANPAFLENGHVSYPKIAASPAFQTGLAHLVQTAQQQRTAIMCAEKEPLNCHRTHLIARQLQATSVTLIHILENGAHENHEHTLARLLKLTRTPDTDLYLSRDDLINQATAKWANRKTNPAKTPDATPPPPKQSQQKPATALIQHKTPPPRLRYPTQTRQAKT